MAFNVPWEVELKRSLNNMMSDHIIIIVYSTIFTVYYSYKYVVDEKMSFYEMPTPEKIRSKRKWERIDERVRRFVTDMAANGCSA